MSTTVSLLTKDVFARGGWILLVMFALQFIFAMHFLGVYIRDAEVALMIMMGLAVLPVRAPSYRFLMTLPLKRRAVDWTDWLFSGGLIAAICTCANLVALAVCWFGAMVAVDGYRLALLLMGAPGLIGLSVISMSFVFRYSGVGANRIKRERPYLLPAFVSPVFLVFVDGRANQGNPLLELGGLVAFAIGCFVLVLLSVSPDKYRHWINRRPRPSQRSNGAWMLTSSWRLIASIALLGGLPAGAMLGFVYCSPNGPFVKLLLLSLLSVNGLMLVRTIKVFRSFPWSIHQCTMYLYTGLLGPPLIAMLTAFEVGSWRSCMSHDFDFFLSAILPLLAISTTVSVVIAGLILRDKLRPFYALAIMLGAVFAIVDNAGELHAGFRALRGGYAALAQFISVLVLTATYFWLRHEIRTNSILLHDQPSGLPWFNAR